MKTVLATVLCLSFSPTLFGFPAQVPDAGDERWATVRGQVVFGGENVPTPETHLHRASGVRIAAPNWIINDKNKGLKNVFIWLAADEKDRGVRMPKELIHSDLQKVAAKTIDVSIAEMQFEPNSIGAQTGQQLRFTNTGVEATNLKFQAAVTNGNLLVPPGKDHTIPNLRVENSPLLLSSSIHSWMHGYVRIFEHPYFAVTDADGKFEIRLAPVRPMRIYVWHPQVGFLNGVKGNKGDPIVIKPRGLDVGTISIKPVE